jgi:hypothetical protein
MSISREGFLLIKLPNLPYCEYSRGPSTSFNESFHIQNKNTGVCINLWWRSDNTISVGLYKGKEKNPWKKTDTLVQAAKNLSQKKISSICVEYLNSEASTR